MEISRYTYFVPDGDKTIIFNGLTNGFVEVKSSNAAAYKQILENPEKYYEKFHDFIDKMLRNGILIENKEDDDKRLAEKYNSERRPDQYYMMILPTYQCNLRCWYCVQDHQEMWMSEDTKERIKKRIILKLSDPSVKELHISWFGGEPIMAYDIVLEITEFARRNAEEVGKHFSCEITTNSTLLNAERIESLRKAGVTSYQITIDGKREVHNAIKHLENESAFDKALENINLIGKHTKCSLRFNYTHKNLEPDEIIEGIKEHLSEESKKNITFLLYKVWQENQESIDGDSLERLIDLACKEGIQPKLPLCGICYVDQVGFDCIYPNGMVGKCDNEPPGHEKGWINENGEVEWEILNPAHISAFEAEDSECKECRYLPYCWGPCVAKRKNMLKENGRIICMYTDRDKEIESLIRNYCRNVSFSKINR